MDGKEQGQIDGQVKGEVDDYVVKVLKDFESIFMAEGVKRVLGKDYDSFIGPGHVIVRDSTNSDWIYIVKSGSISVMKKLRHVSPRRGLSSLRKMQMATQGLNVTVPYKERKRRRKLLPPLELPEIPRPEYQSHFELQMKMNETLPGIFKENDRLGILDYDTIVQDYKSRLRPSRLPEFPSAMVETTGGPARENTDLPAENPLSYRTVSEDTIFPEISKSSRGVYMSASRRNRQMSVGESMALEDNTHLEQDTHNEHSHAILPLQQNNDDEEVEAEPEEISNQPGNIEGRPTFILVQVLEKGQYFGIGEIVFREVQPSLSVISNGAECLLLSKSFFKQHATEHIINDLRKTEVPYPSDNDLQQKLQEHTDWLSYRSDTYRRLVEPLINSRIRRAQFTTNFRGQYDFRSGPT